jgi:hypothetical protein
LAFIVLILGSTPEASTDPDASNPEISSEVSTDSEPPKPAISLEVVSRDPDHSLDTFDFDFNKKMNRALVYEPATECFIAQRDPARLPRDLS